ncbi:MAG: hypothetical protein C0467_19725 [Planctomycetaceae bacterium]|nr:hypothetical protein [Planctomycetaceae bacterium]
MTDRESLLASVLADPADDTTRLVLADFFREADDPETRARGQFLWGGVTAGSFREDELIEDRLYYTAQAEIAAVASAGFPAEWLAAIGIGPNPLSKRDWVWDCTRDRVTVRIGTVVGVYLRGMLSELSLALDEWYQVATAAMESWPIERVAITSVPGVSFHIAKVEVGWCLSARLKLPDRRVPLTGSIVPAGVSPAPTLVTGPADWRVEEFFADRTALVNAVGSASAILVASLREVAGDRWPTPPRRR